VGDLKLNFVSPGSVVRFGGEWILCMSTYPMPGKEILVFHGTGPEPEPTRFLTGGSIGIAWSDDLVHWSWPDKKLSKSCNEKVRP
jgi:hypothetical protein